MGTPEEDDDDVKEAGHQRDEEEKPEKAKKDKIIEVHDTTTRERAGYIILHEQRHEEPSTSDRDQQNVQPDPPSGHQQPRGSLKSPHCQIADETNIRISKPPGWSSHIETDISIQDVFPHSSSSDSYRKPFWQRADNLPKDPRWISHVTPSTSREEDEIPPLPGIVFPRGAGPDAIRMRIAHKRQIFWPNRTMKSPKRRGCSMQVNAGRISPLVWSTNTPRDRSDESESEPRADSSSDRSILYMLFHRPASDPEREARPQSAPSQPAPPPPAIEPSPADNGVSDMERPSTSSDYEQSKPRHRRKRRRERSFDTNQPSTSSGGGHYNSGEENRDYRPCKRRRHGHSTFRHAQSDYLQRQMSQGHGRFSVRANMARKLSKCKRKKASPLKKITDNTNLSRYVRIRNAMKRSREQMEEEKRENEEEDQAKRKKK